MENTNNFSFTLNIADLDLESCLRGIQAMEYPAGKISVQSNEHGSEKLLYTDQYNRPWTISGSEENDSREWKIESPDSTKPTCAPWTG